MNTPQTINDIKNLLDSANELEAMKEKELKDGWFHWFSGVSLLNIFAIFGAGCFISHDIANMISLISVFIIIGNLIADIPQKYAEYRLKNKSKIPAMLQSIDNIFMEENVQRTILNYIIEKYNKYPKHLDVKNINSLQMLFINKSYTYAREKVIEIFNLIDHVESQQKAIENYNSKLNIDKIIETEQEKEYELSYNLKELL